MSCEQEGKMACSKVVGQKVETRVEKVAEGIRKPQ
jgi:hypothetical protein